jgi:hypothetical protein
MNTGLKAFLSFGLLVLCGGGLPAQEVSTAPGQVSVLISRSGAPAPQTVTGQPYSAIIETEFSQTLADGTHIKRKMGTTKTYRDSQGRTREEHYMPPDLAERGSETILSIALRDPAQGLTYVLNPRNHTARELTVALRANTDTSATQPTAVREATTSTNGRNLPASLDSPERLAPTQTQEDLGTQVMEGLVVEGTRTTQTFPPGSQGNDRPIQVVTERWESRELHITLWTTRSDPRTGETTTRVTNLDRSEPDPALFQVPPDYTITQE